MFKKHLTLLLAASLLSHAFAAQTFAVPQGETEARRTAKVKAGVIRRGTGERSRVKVKLRDGTRLQGYISRAEEGSFAVTDSETGQTSAVAYRDVAEVKGRGGLSRAAKIGIGVGVALTVVFIGLRASGPVLR